ncbi:MAG: helix-turn-helix transcriptional regulator [Thermodesulfovibrionales bacterium]|jgi:DNA-binding transcriptional regulator YiaG
MNEWLPDDIKTLRKGLGLSQEAFGERIGVSGNYVYLLEKEVKKPSKTLKLLLDFIDAQRRENEKRKEKA